MFMWIVILGALCAVFCAYGIGANDVANAFGSSVGARAITLSQAIGIAAVCEFSGAVLLGGGVSDTIRKGIANVDAFADTPYVRIVGVGPIHSHVQHRMHSHRCSCLACCVCCLQPACGCSWPRTWSFQCPPHTVLWAVSWVRSTGYNADTYKCSAVLLCCCCH